MPDDLSLTFTNADLFLAAKADDGPSAFAKIAKVPCTVLAARNAATLTRLVGEAFADLSAALLPLYQKHGTDDGNGNFAFTAAQSAALETEAAPLMAESRTLQGVRPMKISEMAQGSFVAPEDVRRCGPFLID